MSASIPTNRNPTMQNARPLAADQTGRSRPPEQSNQRGRNPVGSPPPNQRNGPRRIQSRNSNPPIDDAARAALALAAVAQAASAGNRSPAEAAEIAKAQAHHIAQKQQSRRGAPTRIEPRKVQPVNLEAVKRRLQSEVASEDEEYKPSQILKKLADGENDSFLQNLLMIEHLRTVEEVPSEEKWKSQTEDVKAENMKTSYACDRVQLLLSKVEEAYDCLESMLPDVPAELQPDDSETYDVEKPKVVPDLLPPCTSRSGDATLEFFRACLGEQKELASDEKEGPAISNATTEEVPSESYENDDAVNKDAFVDHQEEKNTSMFSSMFTIKRPSFGNRRLSSVFGKKRKGTKAEDTVGTIESPTCEPGEYTVLIEKEMLGLTVENVLERTVVRTVLAGGPAKKAGAKVGSLIVKVGNIETKNLTHFETIDELRQSQRPLHLILRQIPDDALRSAREEMGRLIKGSGFGKIIDGESSQERKPGSNMQRPLGVRSIDLYTTILRNRWIESVNLGPRNKQSEPILRVGEKLVWILTLFIVGLEREAARLLALVKEDTTGASLRSTHNQYQHNAKDYSDAAKSVAKILFDFIKKVMDPLEKEVNNYSGRQIPRGGPARGMVGRGRGRGGRGGRGSMSMGMPAMSADFPVDNGSSDKLLLQIGDILQRTRSFLADPTSPPAALLRGELIACLCDILDADTEMKLSEEESVSSTQGGNTGPITDLGAAGSLLKLIVLNCPIMRSPECEEISSEANHISEDELKQRFGGKKALSGSDFHRLHAGNRFLAVVHRLAASRSTSARITACSLGPVLWSHLDFPHQLQVRPTQRFVKLSKAQSFISHFFL